MAFTNQELDELRVYFVAKRGDNAIDGNLLPKTTETFNLGSNAQKFKTIYAQEIIADTITGGGGGGNADTVDGFSAYAYPVVNELLALNASGTFPIEVYPEAVLLDGSRTITGNLVLQGSLTVDGIDISEHNHDGTAGRGNKVSHQNLLNLEADDHPHYTQWGDDEIITGVWRFVPLYLGTNPEDYTQGWIFEPDDYRLRSLENAFVAIGSPSESSVYLNSTTLSKFILGNNDIQIIKDGAGSRLEFGTGSNYIQLSPTHATHRLWIGNQVADDAPFQVEDDGTLVAKQAYFGTDVDGYWEVIADHIQKQDVLIEPQGIIQLGDGSRGESDYVFLDASGENSVINQGETRIWVGNPDPSLAPFRVSQHGLVHMYSGYISNHLRSTNYVSGQSGWSLESSGRAEMNNIIARGRLEAVVYSERTVSAISGVMQVTEAAVFMAHILPEDDFIIVDSDIFGKNDILYAKPSGTREEWMRVISAPEYLENSTVKYLVTRNLEGDTNPDEFFEGETVVRRGTAAQNRAMYPMAAGNEEAAFGNYQPGGAGSDSGGGWLVLDGSKDTGPFFGVIRREGPVYNQISEVVRIGNLRGIGTYQDEIYGVRIGDDSQFLSYEPDNGLVIYARDGSTTINDDGVRTDLFSLNYAIALQPSANTHLNLRANPSDKSLWLYANGESEKKIMTHDVYDANNDGVVDNSLKVNNIEASTTRSPNKLFPLNSNSVFDVEAYDQAVLLDGSRTMTGDLLSVGRVRGGHSSHGQTDIGTDQTNGNITIGNPYRTAAGTPYIDFYNIANPNGRVGSRIVSDGGANNADFAGTLYLYTANIIFGLDYNNSPRVIDGDIHNIFGGVHLSLGDGINNVTVNSYNMFFLPFDLKFLYYQLQTAQNDNSVVKLQYYNGSTWVDIQSVTCSAYTVAGNCTNAATTYSKGTLCRIVITTANGTKFVGMTMRYKKTWVGG